MEAPDRPLTWSEISDLPSTDPRRIHYDKHSRQLPMSECNLCPESWRTKKDWPKTEPKLSVEERAKLMTSRGKRTGT